MVVVFARHRILWNVQIGTGLIVRIRWLGRVRFGCMRTQMSHTNCIFTKKRSRDQR